MTKLSLATLKGLTKIRRPNYNPANLKPGIVHFGVGNFHRAHQAVYLEDLFGLGLDHDWAIVGAGGRPSDDAMREVLRAQDWLSTVVDQEADHSEARITACMIDYVTISAGEGRHALMSHLGSPDIRIGSMTITEGGYSIRPSSQHCASAHPEIVADTVNPAPPNTGFGL